MVSTATHSTSNDASGNYDQIIDIWRKIPKTNYKEANLEGNLVTPILEHLGIDIHQRKQNESLGTGTGLKADYLVYTNMSQPPVLVIEDKARDAALANASDEEFIQLCEQHNLYKSAVGYEDVNGNGIKQYLDIDKVDPQKLASYGLVFNGDFFQLWRRVDGLIFPLTPIQRMNETTIPELMQQLEYVLSSPKRALVTSCWNRKGGVAKTTNTLNLGAALALEGKRVLFIDWDTQTDLTRAFECDPENYKDWLEDCMKKLQVGKLEQAKSILENTIYSRQFKTDLKNSFYLDILPSETQSLDKFKKRKDIGKWERARLLKKLLNCLLDQYDYIFIDTSPATDVLTLATLLTCDTFLIPTDYSKKTIYHSVDLYQRDLPFIKEERAKTEKLNLGPWNLGIVFSNCPKGVTPQSRLEKQIQNEFQKKGFQGQQLPTRLLIYAQTKSAEYQHKPVICWENSPVTKLYKQLAKEVFLGHHFTDC